MKQIIIICLLGLIIGFIAADISRSDTTKEQGGITWVFDDYGCFKFGTKVYGDKRYFYDYYGQIYGYTYNGRFYSYQGVQPIWGWDVGR